MTARAQYGRTRPQSGRPLRNGLALIAALACLLIVTSIIVSMLQSALSTRRHLRAERDRRQVELLVQAGADRAARLLASQPDFRGDTWNLSAEEIVGSGGGRVTTEVSTTDDAARFQLRVVAEYPTDRDFPVRRSHSIQLSSRPTQSQEQSQ
jgi:type II secretory pathway component PulK